MISKNLPSRQKRPLALIILGAVALTLMNPGPGAQAQSQYSWQTPQAEVTPAGNLKWSPRPFEFVAGEEVRYIDYENGDDSNDGLTRETAWKHHPWDLDAAGNAKKEHGIVTYIFKGGVTYRGLPANMPETANEDNKGLLFGESGEPGNPIRLTSDPSWGEGMARIWGSIRLPAEWVPASQVDHPELLPDAGKVWALDLKPLGVLDDENHAMVRDANSYHGKSRIRMPFLGLFRVDADGSTHTQHLARTPDWQPGNQNFALDYWHTMDAGKYEHPAGKDGIRGGAVDAWLKGFPEDYFVGGYFWQQYGAFMGGPSPVEIKLENKWGPMYVPEAGAISGGAGFGPLAEGLRYMIDNLPQFLDAPEEFYLDPSTGILFYIPREGENPNDLHLEWTRNAQGVHIEGQSHVEISGIDFRFQASCGVNIYQDTSDVTVANCVFEDILDIGVRQSFKNWRSDGAERRYAHNIIINDSRFQDMWTSAICMEATPEKNRVLDHIEVMRNSIFNSGIRHKDNSQTPLPAMEIFYPLTGEIAGNIVEDSWGSGIMVFGGYHNIFTAVEIPLTRIFVHHNRTEDTALAVNDYGGMSLWQGGPIYCYNNNIGNSPGVMPAGITLFGGGGPHKAINLSYPLYLDGAYKVYSFNNVIWARSNKKAEDPYATGTPGYFMVFGFLNQFVNNTLYRTGEGVGGSSGHRNDVLGNLMADVGAEPRKDRFIAHDRQGDPSLVGGGDDGSSGRRGVPTLAYGFNVFHGDAKGGRLVRGTDQLEEVEADTIADLAEKMKAFPIRFPQLGWEVEDKPVVGKSEPGPIENIEQADFRPAAGSQAIDNGVTYFIPFGLSGTVGEWHFTENHAEPSTVTDYAWYMSRAHYHRMMYEFVPPLDLHLSDDTLDQYVEGQLETWARGGVRFDGQRFARVADADMRQDLELPATKYNKFGDLRPNPAPLHQKGKQGGQVIKPWIVPEPSGKFKGSPMFREGEVFRLPEEYRHTLIIRDENLLMEAFFKVDPGTTGVIAGKHDGSAGYQLAVNPEGHAEFTISGDGKNTGIATAATVNDGNWRHVLAEVDRNTGRMTIYLNGKQSAEAQAEIPAEASLDNQADFLVGKAADDTRFLSGVIDFLRVCQGTLEDSRTDIAELYTWQTDGPFKYDMAGNAPVNRRDVGALERLE